MILSKYNFIHYNPFPKVKNAKLEVLIDDDGVNDIDEEDLKGVEEDEKKEKTRKKK